MANGVTISQVAMAAGVSRQTVSNVLNSPDRVAPETAARVRRAIEKLGYRPNRMAQNLRGRASRCIGFKVAPPAGLNNLLDRFLHALTDAAGAAGYHVILFTPASVDEELAAYEDLIGTGTVDGFVLVDVGIGDRRLEWLAQRRVPFVSFGRPWQRAHRYSWVDVDGAYGVARVVDHLAALGHRRIAYLGWPEGDRVGDERRSGWREAMRRHGLGSGGLDGPCVEDVTAVSAVAKRLLAMPDPPTAFACGSDTYAVAARLAGGLDASGRPNVEVVGYDDSPAAALMTPPMSSVRQPLTEVARRVVGLLVTHLQNPGTPPEGVTLRPVLVPRTPQPAVPLRKEDKWHRE